MMKNLIFLFIVFSLGALSCNTENLAPDSERVGFDYFPLTVGDTLTYDVEEIIFEPTGEIDTSVYDLRTIIVEKFNSQAGDSVYVIHRYRKDKDVNDWQFLSTWSAYKNNQQAVMIEGNTPYLKLTFPLENGKVWNGNRLNANEQDEYRVDSLGAKYTGQLSFENTVTIEQSNTEEDIIQLDRRAEIYALNVGLIYKEDLLLNYCIENDCIGQELIDDGRIYIQKIK